MSALNVLSVMDYDAGQAHQDRYNDPHSNPSGMPDATNHYFAERARASMDARSAVAELINASSEYLAGTFSHTYDCKHCKPRIDRLSAALARVGHSA